MSARRALGRALALAAPVVPLFPLLARSTPGSALSCPPAGAREQPGQRSEIGAAIERQPICVGSTVASAGELGDVLYYRSSPGEPGKVSVGYYAFFSEERPWGNNWLTWAVLPALAVDLVYTHALFVGAGLQQLAYGKGDVEGFRIVFSVGEDGSLSADRGVAESGYHREVRLDRADLLSIEPGRPTVYSRWWSHQLGGRGARPGDLVYRRCYGAGAIRPLPPDVALDFRLDRRAAPARVVPAAALLGPRVSPRLRGLPAVDQGLARRPSVAL
ncbi:hypothetical protein [Sorangium sp. So ce131]|uniref:hypothetical protein n=1 Tax=Sorangium sp. So ce131 TaxID=3133282 RepID=UPI003F6139FB